ncbi:MAG TPA: DUF6682 family protein [Noviherbaspirillum sp.]|nr:DUF6682 family protein [Noviherbaspirillum sp.]
MPIAVADVLARTDDLLMDADRVRWTAEERIRWINEAAGAILIRRPAARAMTVALPLSAGTLQAIPDNGVQFLDLVCNLAADGVTAGRVIRRTDRQLLDDADPDWHAAKPVATVKQYTFDDRMPKTFYVYPPAIAGTKVRLVHAELPPSVSASTDSFDLQPEYLGAVVNYVCYRANSKDSEFANGAVATAFYQAFEAELGIQSQVQVNASPNQPTTSV